MSYTLNKTGAQIDAILNRAEAGGQLDLDIAAEAAARAAADALKAPLASPALTGTPTAPTAAPGTDTTQLATTAFANAAAAAAAASAASGKADKVAGATAGNLAGLDASGNLTDAGIAAADVATKADVQNITPKRTASNDPSNSSFSALCDTALAGQAKPKLYGKSVVINQLVADSPKSYSIAAGGAVGVCPFTIVAGHTFYLKVKNDTQNSVRTSAYGIVPYMSAAALYNGYEGVIVSSSSAPESEAVSLKNDGDSTATGNIYCNAIDLTAIFTAAELATIGTSPASLKTAWLKKFGYPLPSSMPKNTGSIVCNNATYRLHGRNLWDEEWELGGYDATTGAPTTLNQVRSKATDPIKVSPSTSICFYNASARISNVYWYDANDQYIGRTQNASANPFVTTSPDNAAFARFGCPSGYGTTYKSDICVNVSDASFNGSYEAWYDGGSVTADALNGIGTAVDSQDAEGQIVRKIGTLDLSTITWNGSSGNYYVGGSALWGNTNTDLLHPVYYVGGSGENSMNVANGNLIIRSTATPTGILYYAKATPTTDSTSASDLSTQAGYNSLDPVSGDVQSADASVEYAVDVIAYIDKKLAEL